MVQFYDFAPYFPTGIFIYIRLFYCSVCLMYSQGELQLLPIAENNPSFWLHLTNKVFFKFFDERD